MKLNELLENVEVLNILGDTDRWSQIHSKGH